jgi:hypothetical protein
MKITIAERLKPFSHQPGVTCVLPGSDLVVQVFPVLIKVGNKEIPLELTGPVEDFTVQMDLEKGCLWIWGVYREGYQRFCLWSEEGSFRFAQTRGSRKTQIPSLSISSNERLSLGCHKKQDWSLVDRRRDLKEILPHWLRLVNLLPPVKDHSEGTAALFDQLSFEKQSAYDSLSTVYQIAFKGMLCPTLENRSHLGIAVKPVSGTPSPLAVLTRGAALIRNLFIRSSEEISVLPCLPPQFHCGRYLSVDLGSRGELDFEWSKKMIRRLVFRSQQDQDFAFKFQKDVKDFRLRCSLKDKGKTIPVGSVLSFQAGHTYFFDRFQK